MSISWVLICVNSVLSFGTMRYSILFSLGAPRKYCGLATNLISTSFSYDATRNGPVPIGWLLKSAWLMSAICPSRCFGKMQYDVLESVKNVRMNGAYDLVR